MELLNQIDLTSVPNHIAIIMDGNGRWAKQHGHERLYGHSFGVDSVRASLTACKNIGASFLTIYAFSTENWNRPQDEVNGLMNLLVTTIANEVDELNEQGVRLISIGDVLGLPEDCQLELKNAKEATKNNQKITLVIALNYSSRLEITQAVKNLALGVKKGELNPEDITEEEINTRLYTAQIPDPELIIRTSGEQRLSNFLLWQCAYSEFYFTPVLWPDFREEHLYQAVLNYQTRERRFGMISEQL
ncbi:MAG TPA: isoprenyl transferase [Fluviicola sp.]|nr:isoprenyl transferase [Fluviicola sp.]